jgi:hypothetical protein
MLSSLIQSLEKGVTVNDHAVNAHKIAPGRFREEQNIELHYRVYNKERFLLNAKVFHGRRPEYSPWVELFDIEKKLDLDTTQLSYFESPFEDLILRIFSENHGPGAKLFVEYYNDTETRRELAMGFPAVLSRLGYRMFNLGFTWFKDWYFPEGYLEGNQKLQGEKPDTSESRERQTKIIIDEIEKFLIEIKQSNTDSGLIQHALERAAAIISTVRS